MAAATTTTPARPLRPRALALHAIEHDSTTDMSAALSSAAAESPPTELLAFALPRAVHAGATAVLDLLLSRGADPRALAGSTVAQARRNFAAVLARLQRAGWDIDARRTGSGSALAAQPLLWHVVGDEGAVRACLDAGARVEPVGQDAGDVDDVFACPPVLERAAGMGSRGAIDALRRAGAPRGRRMLHFAARSAVGAAEGEERFEVVRALVEGEMACDVNADDQREGESVPGNYGPPLCWVASVSGESAAVVRYLLGKGADPRRKNYFGKDALEVAQAARNARFVEEVQMWEAEEGGK